MSKLGKKVSGRLNNASGVLAKAGARHGRAGLAAANAVSSILLGRYVELCDDGVDCADPNHEHVDLLLRD
ncbi:hypothetical protein [Streptomyces sp. NPDC002467]|uniref:hypothetical protein n=1 Tax=Streptomyces sp. NPDC002467 TaxID=3364647 RepID=UPI0036C2E64C